jgi:transmembrane sensor
MGARAAFPDKVLDQAILWRVRLTSGDAAPELFARCSAWRQADPLHEAAWQALQTSERMFAPLPPGHGRAAVEALASVGQSRRQALKLLGLGLGVGGATWWAWQQPRLETLRADYATGTGERRTLELADGTRLQLNTATAVNVRFTSTLRSIELLRGEIFVETGKDPSRPLMVQIPQGSLRPIGTAFAVRMNAADTLLAVTQGVVAIQTNQGQTLVPAGQRYRIDASGDHPLPQGGLDPAAWTQGAVVAKQLPLKALLDEFARYQHGWLGCDPAVAHLQVSGVYQLGHLEQTLDTLAQRLPIRIQHFTPWWIRVVPRRG